MCCIVTMLMEKATRISRDDATGCLNSESEFAHISVFLILLGIVYLLDLGEKRDL